MKFTVNGKPCEVDDSRKKDKIIHFLREDLGLTGTKNGCGIGACGACTIVLGNKAVRACFTPLAKAEGQEILTVEGLADLVNSKGGQGGTLHPVQQAFMDAGAVQCGFCTPGFIMKTIVLLQDNPKPTRDEIRKAFRNNLCRCTGYQQIIDAVELASNEI